MQTTNISLAPFNFLPDEIVISILSNLNVSELALSKAVSHRQRRLALEEFFNRNDPMSSSIRKKLITLWNYHPQHLSISALFPMLRRQLNSADREMRAMIFELLEKIQNQSSHLSEEEFNGLVWEDETGEKLKQRITAMVPFFQQHHIDQLFVNLHTRQQTDSDVSPMLLLAHRLKDADLAIVMTYISDGYLRNKKNPFNILNANSFFKFLWNIIPKFSDKQILQLFDSFIIFLRRENDLDEVKITLKRMMLYASAPNIKLFIGRIKTGMSSDYEYVEYGHLSALQFLAKRLTPEKINEFTGLLQNLFTKFTNEHGTLRILIKTFKILAIFSEKIEKNKRLECSKQIILCLNNQDYLNCADEMAQTLKTFWPSMEVEHQSELISLLCHAFKDDFFTKQVMKIKMFHTLFPLFPEEEKKLVSELVFMFIKQNSFLSPSQITSVIFLDFNNPLFRAQLRRITIELAPFATEDQLKFLCKIFLEQRLHLFDQNSLQITQALLVMTSYLKDKETQQENIQEIMNSFCLPDRNDLDKQCVDLLDQKANDVFLNNITLEVETYLRNLFYQGTNKHIVLVKRLLFFRPLLSKEQCDVCINQILNFDFSATKSTKKIECETEFLLFLQQCIKKIDKEKIQKLMKLLLNINQDRPSCIFPILKIFKHQFYDVENALLLIPFIFNHQNFFALTMFDFIQEHILSFLSKEERELFYGQAFIKLSGLKEHSSDLLKLFFNIAPQQARKTIFSETFPSSSRSLLDFDFLSWLIVNRYINVEDFAHVQKTLNIPIEWQKLILNKLAAGILVIDQPTKKNSTCPDLLFSQRSSETGQVDKQKAITNEFRS